MLPDMGSMKYFHGSIIEDALGTNLYVPKRHFMVTSGYYRTPTKTVVLGIVPFVVTRYFAVALIFLFGREPEDVLGGKNRVVNKP